MTSLGSLCPFTCWPEGCGGGGVVRDGWNISVHHKVASQDGGGDHGGDMTSQEELSFYM